MGLFAHCWFGVWKFKGQHPYGKLSKILLLHKKCMDFVLTLDLHPAVGLFIFISQKEIYVI